MAFASDKGRQGAAGQGAGGFSIDNSLRFNDNDSAYLQKTPSSAGNKRTFTHSFWVKRGNLFSSSQIHLFAAGNGAGSVAVIQFDNDSLRADFDGDSSGLKTTQVFRDTSAWYHFVIATDSTQSTTSDRVKIYCNGTQITDLSISNYPTLNEESNRWNNTVDHRIGMHPGAGSASLDAYLAEVHFIDGTALTPSSFGETGDYGEWKPIKYAGTYGTTGFYLDFANTADNTSFTDSSSNSQTLTTYGSTFHSTTQKKIGSTGIYFDGSGDYISAADDNILDLGTGDFTAECWIWINSGENYVRVFNHGGSGSSSNTAGWYFNVHSSGVLNFGDNTGTTASSSAHGISTTTWTHIAVVRDSGTIRFFVDGVAKGTGTHSGNITSAQDFRIGALWDSATSNSMNGYMDEIRLSNSARYTSGFTPSTTAFTSDSNTLLLIHSDFSALPSLGNDANGSNNWTTNNLAATDQMLDSPTNNFATWNVLTPVDVTLSEGNLKSTNGSGYDIITATIPMQSGKWYWEILIQASSGYDSIGILDPNACGMIDEFLGARNCGSYGYNGWTGAKKANDGSNIAYGDSYASAGNVMGVAYDGDNGTITFYKNGVSQGQAFSGIDTTKFYTAGYSDYDNGTGGAVVANFGQDSSFAGNKTSGSANANDGTYGDFYYTPPTGFLALCTSNLTAPAVKPQENFNVVTYAGNGSTQSITGVGFQPDFIWTKQRSLVTRNHSLTDIVRGVTKNLGSDLAEAEGTASNRITAFDSDGFSLGDGGYVNASSDTYVAWNWKAGNATLGTGDFTQGSIASTCSRNVDAGFSIVSYTGTGSLGTVGHGLGSIPEMIIVKNRTSSGGWIVMHKDIASDYETDYIRLDSSNAAADYEPHWADTKPTASLFTVKSDNPNTSTNAIIAYCFHSVDGYSKVGSYTGNGSADGPFVYTGFRPAYVMYKNKTTTGTHWIAVDTERDTYNPIDKELLPSLNNAESDASANLRVLDILSNGFKIRGSDGVINTNGNTYIFLAFAEHPFKYTTAR